LSLEGIWLIDIKCFPVLADGVLQMHLFHGSRRTC